MALTGKIWGFHPTEGEKKQINSNKLSQIQQQPQQTNQQLQSGGGLQQANTAKSAANQQKIIETTQHHNIYQKLTIIGINEEFLKPSKTIIRINEKFPKNCLKGAIAININQISMLRYTLMMLLIIILQGHKMAMLVLLLVVQLALVGAVVYLGFAREQFNSPLTSVVYLIFEGILTILITGLLLLSSVDRKPINSDKSYWRGTIPLVILISLTIILKTLQIIFAAVEEYERTKKENQNEQQVDSTRSEKVKLMKKGSSESPQNKAATNNHNPPQMI